MSYMRQFRTSSRFSEPAKYSSGLGQKRAPWTSNACRQLLFITQKLFKAMAQFIDFRGMNYSDKILLLLPVDFKETLKIR